jgi:hypothetical protein
MRARGEEVTSESGHSQDPNQHTPMADNPI